MALFSPPKSFTTLLADPSALLHHASAAASPHPSLPHLMLLVFAAILEVVCVSLPGYIVARMGNFDAEAQKFVANLNVTLFTPCLIFTKLASQLTAEKLADLAIIPFIFAVQTLVSYFSAVFISRCFRLRKRQSNFVVAMGVFGNSNSLPISLVISLSKTLSGLHWDRIPNDNDDEVGARGILYLLIFQQLGQLVRWTWGYRVLLAPREHYLRDEEEPTNSGIASHERYSDNPNAEGEHTAAGSSSNRLTPSQSTSSLAFSSGDETPIEAHSPLIKRSRSTSYVEGFRESDLPLPTAFGGAFLPRRVTGNIVRFPDVEPREERNRPQRVKSWAVQKKDSAKAALFRGFASVGAVFARLFARLPLPLQRVLRRVGTWLHSFSLNVWEFMSAPLWAMLVAIVVASVPKLQQLFFAPDTFISNSVTRAIEQSGGVAVPLILVVLGANLERSTLPKDLDDDENPDDPRGERKLVIASLLARMFLPTLIMGPILALMAKFVPVSILDDPIFIVVCFLLTGAPSALQLAQICQINGVFMGAMSKVLFQSYVIWILPSTLILVVCALKVVEWATA